MKEVRLSKVAVRVPNDGLITYRFKIAASDRNETDKIVAAFLSKRGLTLGFNASYELTAIREEQPIFAL